MSLEYILSKFQVFLDCHFHQTLDCHKVVFWQTCLQEIMQIVVKCCLNHLRKKYKVLNNNGSEGKMFGWIDFKRTCIKWVNAVFKIMFKSMFLRWLKPNLYLVNNFRPKGWWILYIMLRVGRLSLCKIFLNFLKKFSLCNCKSSLFHSQIYKGKWSIWRHLFYNSMYRLNAQSG